MEEKKLTDEELVKSIECCIKYNCRKCPYILKHIDCVSDKRAEKDFIDLIKRLQAKNNELQKQVDELKAENTELYKEHTTLIAGSILQKKQAVKDTVKEIWDIVMSDECSVENTFDDTRFTQIIKERYGVEVK